MNIIIKQHYVDALGGLLNPVLNCPEYFALVSQEEGQLNQLQSCATPYSSQELHWCNSDVNLSNFLYTGWSGDRNKIYTYSSCMHYVSESYLLANLFAL